MRPLIPALLLALAAPCRAAEPAALYDALREDTGPVNENWRRHAVLLMEQDVGMFVDAVFDKLQEFTGPELRENIIWNNDVGIGTGVFIGCDPVDGYFVEDGESPALTNICRLQDGSVHEVVAISGGLLDLARQCGGGAVSIDAVAFAVAHEISHLAGTPNDPMAIIQRRVSSCQTFLQRDEQRSGRLCEADRECKEAATDLQTNGQSPERVRRVQIALAQICNQQLEREFAAFNRQLETQADQNAYTLMSNAGFTHEGSQCLLSNLKTLEEAGWYGELPPPALATHPETADRMRDADAAAENFRAPAPRLNAGAGFSFD